MLDTLIGLGPYAIVLAIIAFAIFLAMAFRRVVEPNEIHIVNRRGSSDAYGRPPVDLDSEGQAEYEVKGNAYYEWPGWVPYFGVTKVVVPLSNFNLELEDYEAYDDGKVPFVVDVMAFFRVSNPIIAAQRVHIHDDHDPLKDLKKQLIGVLEGVVRSILATEGNDVKTIMSERSTFGEQFTEETVDQLPEWGIVNIRNIELMDIRDSQGSQTISNIMAMKESLIEKESRIEVAGNQKEAQEAEIAAQQSVDIKEQSANQAVGERTAQNIKAVGVAEEHAQQDIKAQKKETAEKEMDVQKVNDVRSADIARDVAEVEATQDKNVMVIKANGEKDSAILVADGTLYEQERDADGTLAVGKAEAEAKRLGEMAIVKPKLELAEGIGANLQYQDYMVRIEVVGKDEAVGVANAAALEQADIKIIANTGGDISTGINSVGEFFSSKGGTNLGAMVEAFAQTEVGEKLLSKVNGNGTG
jgi:flotillin